MKPEILFEDDDLLAVNKPAGISVIPDRFNTEGSGLNKLLEAQMNIKLFVVHRLDRDTSGVLLFAKTPEAHRALSLQFQEHTVEKFYLGLVDGRVFPAEGRIEKPIAEHPTIKGKMVVARKGKASITDYTVVEQWPMHALLQLQIHTGRTHQIRVHMQSIGHPILADEVYGDGKPFLLSSIKKKFRLSQNEEAEKPLLSRLALHAHKLAFTDMHNKRHIAEAPLPRDMAACINQLNKTFGSKNNSTQNA